MKKLFLLSFLGLSLAATAADNNAQLCQLFEKSGAKNSKDMANIALMSGALKKDKNKEQIQALIQKTIEEYNKTNPKPKTPVCEQIERNLGKANLLNFQSKLSTEALKPIPENKTEIKALPKPSAPASAVLIKPQTISESLKGVSRADSYKIYNILKSNNYFSNEGKKENKRKEIIEIINKALSGKSGQLDSKEIAKIEKDLKEKNFLK